MSFFVLHDVAREGGSNRVMGVFTTRQAAMRALVRLKEREGGHAYEFNISRMPLLDHIWEGHRWVFIPSPDFRT